MKKLLLLTALLFSAAIVVPAQKIEREWVDLALPSGTLWAAQPEEGYYTYNQAREAFGGQLPTEWQWDELIKSCDIEKDYGKKSFLKLTGKNGNTLVIPSMGMMAMGSKPHDLDKFAFWSFTTAYYDKKYAYYFGNTIEVRQANKSWHIPVLLVNK